MRHDRSVPDVNPTAAYRAARDQLLAADSPEAARAGFRWPDVGDTFNWATDWFDVIATDNSRTALWIVEEDGREQRLSYGEMAARSDRLAARLHGFGVQQGDHVLVMLGNQLEALGDDARRDQARCGHPADVDDARHRRPAGPRRPYRWRTSSRTGARRTSTTTSAGPSRGSSSAVPLTGGRSTRATWATPLPPTRSVPTSSPARPTRAWSTSRPARRRSRRWSCTPRRRTRSGTSARCTGSASGPVTCT